MCVPSSPQTLYVRGALQPWCLRAAHHVIRAFPSARRGVRRRDPPAPWNLPGGSRESATAPSRRSPAELAGFAPSGVLVVLRPAREAARVAFSAGRRRARGTHGNVTRKCAHRRVAAAAGHLRRGRGEEADMAPTHTRRRHHVRDERERHWEGGLVPYVPGGTVRRGRRVRRGAGGGIRVSGETAARFTVVVAECRATAPLPPDGAGIVCRHTRE